MRTFSLSCLPTSQTYPQDPCANEVESETRRGGLRAEAWNPLKPFLPSFRPQLMTTLPRGTSHLERATSAMAPWCSSSARSQASHCLRWYGKGGPPDPCRRYDPCGQGWRVSTQGIKTPIQFSPRVLSALWGWIEVKGWHGGILPMPTWLLE